MKSFIAVHETNGIYLGVFAGYGLFSNTDIAAPHAIRFNSEKEIREFFKKTAPKIADEMQAIPIETKSTDNYVSVVDIIKSGYNKHIYYMIDNMFMINETIH